MNLNNLLLMREGVMRGDGVLEVPLVIEHCHTERHIFVIQFGDQVLAGAVADVGRELEAGAQKGVGIVTYKQESEL